MVGFLRTCINILSFLIILSSCGRVKNKPDKEIDKSPIQMILEDQNHFYNEQKKMVDKELLLHFPKVLDTCNLQIVGPPIDKEEIYSLQITNKLHDTTIIEEFSKMSIAQYFGDDNCLLTIDKIESFKNYPETHFDQCLEIKFPIPTFKRNKYRDLSTESKLPGDFRIFVIEAKSDTVPSNPSLMNHWHRGFSRGIAFSNKEMVIIYWVIKWE